MALIDSVSSAGGPTGGTTAAIDTTGATLLAAVVGSYSVANVPTVSDSKGNTWTQLTTRINGNARETMWYVVNPTVGSGHTFTLSGGDTFYGSLSVEAHDEVLTVSPFDASTGSDASGTTIQPGSLTPAEDNELLIAGVGGDTAATMSINSSFVLSEQQNFNSGQNLLSAIAHKYQTSASAENPTWTASASSAMGTTLAAFKTSGGSASTAKPFRRQPTRFFKGR